MEIRELSSLNVPEAAVYARLTEHQLKKESGLFIAEGVQVALQAMNAGYEPASFLMERKHITGKASALVARADVPVFTADSEVLAQLTGFPLTRGVLCAMKRRKLPDTEEICRNAYRVAVLENLVDPTNVGAIFRNAAALGADAVLLSKDCCDPLHRKALRTGMGTMFHVPWTYLGAGAPLTEQLHGMGFAAAAMALDARAVSISDVHLRQEKRLAILLGTEGSGLKPETVAGSDYTVMIPMSSGVDSLNVAAASAIAMWELCGKNRG